MPADRFRRFCGAEPPEMDVTVATYMSRVHGSSDLSPCVVSPRFGKAFDGTGASGESVTSLLSQDAEPKLG